MFSSIYLYLYLCTYHAALINGWNYCLLFPCIFCSIRVSFKVYCLFIYEPHHHLHKSIDLRILGAPASEFSVLSPNVSGNPL